MSNCKLNADATKTSEVPGWEQSAAQVVGDLLTSATRDQLVTSRVVVILKDLLLSLRLPSAPSSDS